MQKPGKHKICTVLGARPQFIKAGILSAYFKDSALLEEIIIHTGQHYDEKMSDQFFTDLDIPQPDHQLAINQLGHGAMTGRMLEGIENIFIKEQPQMVLVYGDTNSTLAGALAAKKCHIPLVHVEAGLRSFNTSMPEEVNRILTDRISDLLFCPTESAIKNLDLEGFKHFDAQIERTGDIMEDAALNYIDKADELSTIIREKDIRDDYILCTFHRAENTQDKDRLHSIVKAINHIHQNISNIVIPLHPGTKKALEQNDLKLECKTIEPVGYLAMLTLIHNANFIMTDSGGLQKEAFFLNKYCLTLRDETEWVELTDHHYNFLAGANYELILKYVKELKGRRFLKEHHFYGGGKAGKKMFDLISKFLA